MCEGVVFLKQWKQGNTFLVNLRKTSRDRGLFFMQTNYFFSTFLYRLMSSSFGIGEFITGFSHVY